MPALRQPDFSKNYYPKTPTQQANHQNSVARKPQIRSAKVLKTKTFPTANTLPNHLKTLSLLQKGSFGLAIASMAASIGLYMSTVQIPKLWSQEYQHLEDLQRQERQLISINETIKYQIAQEASQNSNLAISKPESAVFIDPAKVELRKQPDNRKNQFEEVALKYGGLGY